MAPRASSEVARLQVTIGRIGARMRQMSRTLRGLPKDLRGSGIWMQYHSKERTNHDNPQLGRAWSYWESTGISARQDDLTGFKVHAVDGDIGKIDAATRDVGGG